MISHLELTKMGKTVPKVKVPKKTKRERRRKKKRKWKRKTRSLTRGEDRLALGSNKSSNLVETPTEEAEPEKEKVEGLDDSKESHDNEMSQTISLDPEENCAKVETQEEDIRPEN